VSLDPEPDVVTEQNPDEISDNRFQSVIGRDTVNSDRERIESARDQRVVVNADQIEMRKGGANPAAFALSTTHKVGERKYRRSGSKPSRAQLSQKCRRFSSPDDAQRRFLERGGPQRDPMRIDPDGDGFACGWSPERYRALKVSG
jgi:hypothetical protein